MRPYSLCGDPADRHCYQLGILKDSQSKGGSLAAHALREGESVTVSLPRNLFALDEGAAHSLLIGGGIGITPMLAMAAELHAAGRAFSLHYCTRSRSQAAFVAELEKSPWADRVWLHFSDEQRIDLPAVLSDVPDNTHVYVCGPTRLMDAVSEQANALGYAAEKFIRSVSARKWKFLVKRSRWWRQPAGLPCRCWKTRPLSRRWRRPD
ncbi:ferredoxin reductase [Pseudocitrobacter faecalis]